MQGIYAVGVAGVALGIARAMLDAFEDLAARKNPEIRPLGQQRRGTSQRGATGGTSRRSPSYLTDTLTSIWSADDSWVIDVPSRARVRLACCFAIQAAEAVADYTYKAAGTDAIFLGTPFERRFRDMHTRPSRCSRVRHISRRSVRSC